MRGNQQNARNALCSQYLFISSQIQTSFPVALKDDIKTIELLSTKPSSYRCFSEDAGVTMERSVVWRWYSQWPDCQGLRSRVINQEDLRTANRCITSETLKLSLKSSTTCFCNLPRAKREPPSPTFTFHTCREKHCTRTTGSPF